MRFFIQSATTKFTCGNRFHTQAELNSCFYTELWSSGSSGTPGVAQGNLELTSLPHYLGFTQRSHFVQLHQEQKEPISQVDESNTCN